MNMETLISFASVENTVVLFVQHWCKPLIYVSFWSKRKTECSHNVLGKLQDIRFDCKTVLIPAARLAKIKTKFQMTKITIIQWSKRVGWWLCFYQNIQQSRQGVETSHLLLLFVLHVKHSLSGHLLFLKGSDFCIICLI